MFGRLLKNSEMEASGKLNKERGLREMEAAKALKAREREAKTGGSNAAHSSTPEADSKTTQQAQY